MSDRAFQEIMAFVEDELGFASSHYDESYLRRRVSARMRRTRTETYEEYRTLLGESDDEQAELLDALSINVTGFFRNPDVWERLRSVLRSLTGDRDRVRLWSAACSDGREPYSFALLALADPEIDAESLSITATDIDQAVLEVAGEGVYRSTKTTDIAEELAPLDGFEEFVERDGDSFAVADEVTDLVTFENHDLISGDPKSEFDLVSCRNLFIYIGAEHKRPILRTVERSLTDGGYLVIGKTETLPADVRESFDPVDKRLRIYRAV